MEFESQYKVFLNEYLEYETEYCDELKTYPSVLGESMKYSLQSGGKKIRPVLMLAVSSLLGVNKEVVLPFALALEMIHTYSLIHDDLPCMDDDDYRRGKLSNHKKFGEANAVLSGDALLNEAYKILFNECVKGEKQVKTSCLLSDFAGKDGMIIGQSSDLYFSNADFEVSLNDLKYIYENKTGKLLLAPILIPSILADNKNYEILEKFGKSLGLLFQITDDILDVLGDFNKLGKSIGKDKEQNKLTSVKFYGLEGAKEYADKLYKDAFDLLNCIDGDTVFLKQLTDFVRNRDK